jgi:electron transfer flavoprotein alpha subunit
MSLLLIAFDWADAEQLAGFAQAFGKSFDLLQLTGDSSPMIGASQVKHANLEITPSADSLGAGLAGAIQGYTHVALVSSMRSKDLIARVAGLVDGTVVTDAIAFESETVFKRPILAGAVVATVETLSSPVLLTIRPAGFGKSESRPNGGSASVEIPLAIRSERIRQSARQGSRPDLSVAKVVVSGGRPLKDAATFEAVIGGLADALGGAVGATRAAVDSGIAANELQVGQTGKIVAPDLYIAAGISGSTQHMAGIKDSKVIVAINKDSDAPIFENADFGLVADLFDAVPELTMKVKTP